VTDDLQALEGILKTSFGGHSNEDASPAATASDIEYIVVRV
jgi:hypothetical protein